MPIRTRLFADYARPAMRKAAAATSVHHRIHSTSTTLSCKGLSRTLTRDGARPRHRPKDTPRLVFHMHCYSFSGNRGFYILPVDSLSCTYTSATTGPQPQAPVLASFISFGRLLQRVRLRRDVSSPRVGDGVLPVALGLELAAEEHVPVLRVERSNALLYLRSEILEQS